MPINWQDGASGGTPLSASNLNKLAVVADMSVTGTPTGDAVKAAAAAVAKANGDAAYDAKGAATTAQAAAVQRANHTGTQSADTITDGTTNKAYTAAEKTKLAGVAAGANLYTDAQAQAANAAALAAKVGLPGGGTDGQALVKSGASIVFSDVAGKQKSQALGNVTGTVTLDASQYTAWSATLTGDTVFNFTNVPASGTVFDPQVSVTQDGTGGHAVTFQSAGTTILPQWTGGTLAVATASAATTIFNFETVDGGANWLGYGGGGADTGNPHTWAALQTFAASIGLPIITPGTTVTGTLTLNNAVTDAMAAAAMGITTGALTNGMPVWDATSVTIAVRTGSNTWRHFKTLEDTLAFTSAGGVRSYSPNSVSAAYFSARTVVPGTSADNADRFQVSTDSSGNTQLLLGAGGFTPDVGFKRSGTGTVSLVGNWPTASIPASDGPQSQGFNGWPFDALLANGGSASSGGFLNLSRIVVQQAATSAGMWVEITVAGATPTSGQCGAVLLDSSGNVLASSTSAAAEAIVATTGLQKVAWQSSVALTAGQVVYAGVFFNATTGPTLARSGMGNVAGLVAVSGTTPKRFPSAGPFTAVPASPLNLVTAGTSSAAFWCAV